jgi:diguanylate cyclase (GGDEF)-like protein
VGQALRAAVAGLAIAHEEAPGAIVTISVGVASVDSHAVADTDALLQLADAALYRAKHLGRDCVVLNGEDPDPALRERRHG